MKILVAEDSDAQRKIIVTMLTKLGHDDVIEARHGGEAWDALRASPVELLLTDWNMPVMDGLELLKEIRRSSAHRDLSVIFFTSRGNKADVMSAMREGVDAYLIKPFTPSQLRTKLKVVAGQRPKRLLERVILGSDPLEREAEHPLIVFGEGATTLEQLGRPDSAEIATFLAAATDALGFINTRSTDLHIGYIIEGNNSDIVKRVRAFRARVKMLLLSNEMGGNAVTLARVASINRQSDLSIFLVCDSLAEHSTKVRDGLERLGVHILERHALDVPAMEGLLNEFVAAAASDGPPSEVPTPQEIRDRLERDIRGMVSLPVLPQVYQQITALDRDPDSDLDAWIDAIEADPLSRAQVIRRARSPLYGFRGEIDEAGKAIILLGKNPVKEIIVSGAVKKSFEGVNADGFSVEDYWIHSVAVGLTARVLRFPLNESSWTPDQQREFEEFDFPDETLSLLRETALYERLSLPAHQDAFTAGVMHDIGKVALSHGYPGLFALVLSEAETQEWKFPLRFAEEALAGGANHTTVGGILAQSWRLGDDVRAVIEKHHDEKPGDPFAQLIAMADFIANGIYPFPKQAQYPAIALLNEADREADGETLGPFLSRSVLPEYNLGYGELLGLGRAITPVVQRLAENIRSSV